MPSTASTLKAVRLAHLYVGVFVAPAILFFAFTGAIQTFSLHESSRGSSYQPPRWLVVLGQIHKKQTPVLAARRPDPVSTPPAIPREGRPPAEAAKPPVQSAPQTAKHNPLPLKIFFLLVSVSLFISTLTGVYMSYKYARNKALITALILLGIVIPTLMILL